MRWDLLSIAIVTLLPVLGSAADLEKIDVWKAGEDGYKIFRIPGIVVSAKGTILAYAEARQSDRGDWNSIDIVLRRSTDGGRTWSASKKIANVEGPKTKNPVAIAQNLANNDDITYNNPVAIADRNGTVHFVFCLEYMRAFYMRSQDDGLTWSKPTEITAAFERFRPEYDWKVLATGPGHGIQLRNGRLLIPIWLSTGTGGHAHRPSVTSVIYSDDGGKNWRRGAVAIPNTATFLNPNETAAIELREGGVMLNARSESKNHRRLVTISKDGATGWSEPKFVDALLEPICMAGFARAGRFVLFSNPHNLGRRDGKVVDGAPRDRRNLTLQISNDEGRTWPVQQVIEPSWSGYSDIAELRQTILILYERGDPTDDRFRAQALTVVRLPLEAFSKEFSK